MSDSKKRDGINEGTKAKASLQLRTMEFMKGYEENQTLESYAQLLCWDIHTTYRTALDSYILPMMRHGYFIYHGDDKYSFIGNGNSNIKVKKGKIEKEESFMDYTKKNSHIKEKESKLTDLSVKNIKGGE